MGLKKLRQVAYDGVIAANPTFKMVLGLCPTLAVTVSAFNGLGMGIATLFVLVLSNTVLSLLKNIIPQTVRIPCFIMVIATISTVTEMIVKKYLPDLHQSLGIFLPLIVVNCIVFARAETFASKNSVALSAADGFFNGLGFTLSLTLLASLRELLGSGTLFGAQVMGSWFPRFAIFTMPAGGFLMLAFLLAAYNYAVLKKDGNTGDKAGTGIDGRKKSSAKAALSNNVAGKNTAAAGSQGEGA